MGRVAELRAHVVEHAENRPGVYRMLGSDGEVLYVGKSVQVRTRLLSYFRATRGEKAARIVSQAERIEWEYAPNEFAALLLELKLIKRLRPRFNRRHKRDRSHCFVKITTEAAPRLVVTDRIRADGARYYGPFRSRGRVRDLLREVVDLLELRDCAGRTPMRFADQADLFPIDDAPLCLRADLGRCLAPCAGRCERAAYLARVELARRFLEGMDDEPIAILRRRMREASERMQFEYAAELRDRMERLRTIRDDLVALAHTLDHLSLVYPVPGHDRDDRVYLIRRGSVHAELRAPRTDEERDALLERARELFAPAVQSPLRVDPYRIAEMLLVARWFRLNPDERRRALAANVVAPGDRIDDDRRTA